MLIAMAAAALLRHNGIRSAVPGNAIGVVAAGFSGTDSLERGERGTERRNGNESRLALSTSIGGQFIQVGSGDVGDRALVLETARGGAEDTAVLRLYRLPRTTTV